MAAQYRHAFKTLDPQLESLNTECTDVEGWLYLDSKPATWERGQSQLASNSEAASSYRVLTQRTTWRPHCAEQF